MLELLKYFGENLTNENMFLVCDHKNIYFLLYFFIYEYACVFVYEWAHVCSSQI